MRAVPASRAASAGRYGEETSSACRPTAASALTTLLRVAAAAAPATAGLAPSGGKVGLPGTATGPAASVARTRPTTTTPIVNMRALRFGDRRGGSAVSAVAVSVTGD